MSRLTLTPKMKRGLEAIVRSDGSALPTSGRTIPEWDIVNSNTVRALERLDLVTVDYYRGDTTGEYWLTATDKGRDLAAPTPSNEREGR